MAYNIISFMIKLTSSVVHIQEEYQIKIFVSYAGILFKAAIFVIHLLVNVQFVCMELIAHREVVQYALMTAIGVLVPQIVTSALQDMNK